MSNGRMGQTNDKGEIVVIAYCLEGPIVYGSLTNENYKGLKVGVRITNNIYEGVEGPRVCSLVSDGEASGPLQAITIDVCYN